MELVGDQAWKLMQVGELSQAEAQYEQAIALASDIGDKSAQAVYLSCLGLCRQSMGKFAEARAGFLACLELSKAERASLVQVQGNFLLGSLERQQGNGDAATQYFLKSLEAALECDDKLGVEMAFGSLGLIYLEQGWAEQASECFRQALESGAESANKVVWTGSLGQALSELGQYKQAEAAFAQAFVLAKKNDDYVKQSICCGSQGNVFYESGRQDEAVKLYKQALSLARKADDQLLEGMWSGNLGNAYRKQGNAKLAVKCCRNALKLAETLDDRKSAAAHLDSLGDCLADEGNIEEALRCYEQALLISQSLHDNQGQRAYLSSIAGAQQRLGRLEPAFDFLRRAIDLFEEQRSQVKSDDFKTSFAVRGQKLYQDMVQICLNLGRRVEALEYVGRAKSRAILDLLSNSPIDVAELASGDDDSLHQLVEKEAQLRNQIARLEKLYWQGPATMDSGSRGSSVQSPDVQGLYAEWRSVVNQLKRRHPNYANLIAVDSLSFDEIQSLWRSSNGKTAVLQDKTAILEFFWTEDYFLSLALWKDVQTPSTHLINDAEELAALNEDLLTFLEMSATPGWDVPLSLGQRLYDRLLRPLIATLPKQIERIILVPHGSLYRLPFSALHDGIKHLVERFALSYVPATSLIPLLSAAATQAKGANDSPAYLVSAISDYSATRGSASGLGSQLRSAVGLADLGYTMEEAQTVFDLGAKEAGATRLLTNQEVNETLPELFGQYPVVHFAGHAVFNPEEPMASGLVFADGSILSAANILEANALKTNCGKLLVLSACQTGVNMVTAGGEILGLARALMYAGMPNLVLSLWEVVDRSTSIHMQHFHQYWKSGDLSISEALQRAQKQAIAEKQPIHSWAPFIHMGIE